MKGTRAFHSVAGVTQERPRVPTSPELLGVSELRSGPGNQSDFPVATQQSGHQSPEGGKCGPGSFWTELWKGWRDWGSAAVVGRLETGPDSQDTACVRACLLEL